ncbi:MAG: hypothetical protein AAB316_06690 [Bacteroidota bacterium]
MVDEFISLVAGCRHEIEIRRQPATPINTQLLYKFNGGLDDFDGFEVVGATVAFVARGEGASQCEERNQHEDLLKGAFFHLGKNFGYVKKCGFKICDLNDRAKTFISPPGLNLPQN